MILVTGAGGNVGSALVARLVELGVEFTAGYRNPAKLMAADALGIPAVSLDLADPDTLTPAFQGVDSIFLLAGGTPDQAELELRAVEAARKNGVRKVVKLSVWDADSEAFTFARMHRQVEIALQGSGMAWTLLRPNGFMQNLVNHHGMNIRTHDRLDVIGADVPISHVDVQDIAAVAAETLTRPGHEQKIYALSGPQAVDYLQIAAMLSAVTGRQITARDHSPAAYSALLRDAGLPAWLVTAMTDLGEYYLSGAAAAVTDDIKQVTGREATALADYLAANADHFA